jgi:hypothetical protein
VITSCGERKTTALADATYGLVYFNQFINFLFDNVKFPLNCSLLTDVKMTDATQQPQQQQGFLRLMQSGLSSIQFKSGSSTFYPSTLIDQRSVKSGWLKKQGGVVKSWHKRWFTLKGDSLYYFQSEDESKSPVGSIFLPGNRVVEISPSEPEKFLFEIVPGRFSNV